MKKQKLYFIPIIIIAMYAGLIYSQGSPVSSCSGSARATLPTGQQAKEILKLKIPYTAANGKKANADLYISAAAKAKLQEIAEKKTDRVFQIVIAGYG